MALKLFILKIISAVEHILRSCQPRPSIHSDQNKTPFAWSYGIQKSGRICLKWVSRAFVCCQRLHPNTEQISPLTSAKTPLGSVFALINIGAGAEVLAGQQWHSSIKARSEAPELCSWHHRPAGLLSRKPSRWDVRQRWRWNSIFDGRGALLQSWWDHLALMCNFKITFGAWTFQLD